MNLLATETIQINYEKIKEIDYIVKSIYRLIVFSRYHEDDDLLDSFFNGMHELTELVSIKNAQMEAQNEDEAKEYLKNLRLALDFIVEEIKAHRNFEKELQLFQLYRLVSPETHLLHPNKYRQSLVQIGSYVCPDHKEVPILVSELFYRMKSTKCQDVQRAQRLFSQLDNLLALRYLCIIQLYENPDTRRTRYGRCQNRRQPSGSHSKEDTRGASPPRRRLHGDRAPQRDACADSQGSCRQAY
jgi:hypothetical protein